MPKEFFTFAKTVQGENHKRREKDPENIAVKRTFPCQDRSYSGYVKNGSIGYPYYITCVCDGHGGDAYFRSATGAQFAVSSLYEAVAENIQDLCGKKSVQEQDIKKIISLVLQKWRQKVDSAFLLEPITQREWDFVKQDDNRSYENFKKGLGLRAIYGTTALCCVVTDFFWFAFQIGDGDIVIQENKKWSKPVPQDESLTFNETTSLCDENAEEEFRFAFGEGKPDVVLCSSDGIGNCFANEEQLLNFYDKVVWLFRDWDGEEEQECETYDLQEMFSLFSKNYSRLTSDIEIRAKRAVEEIENSLPDLSRRGSGDDMSLAGYVTIDPEKVREHIKAQGAVQSGIILWQKNRLVDAAREFIYAGQNGYPEGWFFLGMVYRKAELIEKAVSFLEKAKAAGVKKAEVPLTETLWALGCKEQNAGNHQKAFCALEKAAQMGNRKAQYSVSLYYGRPQDYENCGINQDFFKALEWTMKAAKQGHPEAECKLGKCFRDGRGVQKNAELSHEWYVKAAEHGNIEAQEYLKQENSNDSN